MKGREKTRHMLICSADISDDIYDICTAKRNWNGGIQHPVKDQDIKKSRPWFSRNFGLVMIRYWIWCTESKWRKLKNDMDMYFKDDTDIRDFDMTEELIEAAR